MMVQSGGTGGQRYIPPGGLGPRNSASQAPESNPGIQAMSCFGGLAAEATAVGKPIEPKQGDFVDPPPPPGWIQCLPGR